MLSWVRYGNVTICLCVLHRKMFVFQDVIIDWYFLFHEAAACIITDASDGSDKADAIRKTQNTHSTAAQTGNQGQSKFTQSAENCSATDKTKCSSLQNGHIQRKSQSGDCTVIEELPNPSTAAETESRASQAGASKTHSSAVRNKRSQPNAAALECEHIVLQHCLPPPYVQPPPHPLANSSSVCVKWASARSESTAPETARPVHPSSANSFVPRATHLSIQRSARPSSAGLGNLNAFLLHPVCAPVEDFKRMCFSYSRAGRYEQKLISRLICSYYSIHLGILCLD